MHPNGFQAFFVALFCFFALTSKCISVDIFITKTTTHPTQQSPGVSRVPSRPGEMSFHSGTEGILEELPSQTKEAVEIAPMNEDFFESVVQSVEI